MGCIMNTHRIHRVAKLTGLTKDVIRVWERRYGLLKPIRGANRYRNYSDEDVLLLRFLKQEQERGYSIGDLAELGRDELLARARQSALPARSPDSNPYARLIEQLIQSLDPLDKTSFERKLNGAVAIVPFDEALHGMLIPLQQRVGELWHEGRLSVAVEHYVSKVVQQKLFSVMNQLAPPDHGPKVVVACPPKETHELGAQTVAYHCAVRGFRVIYLGPNTPIDDLSALCLDVQPALVLLSMTLGGPDDELHALAKALAHKIKPLCPVGLGGAGLSAVKEIFEEEGLVVLEDLDSLDRFLERVRSAQSSAPR
ncbi:Cobalamin B12-binding domain-containing protein [Nitrospira tepida]|uniref:Cobalamin B12-binding domain-containing protein n=2 Tax=Nitrospira tepida TaxID=2973512 RepID=A0AA86MVV7_9BACT|nr:Cobalamin B12-binding domain-containing protein [Nitrospira tepida]